MSAPLAVLASAALLASVGAGSYAAGSLVTSKQIKNGTIQVKDLNAKTVTTLKGQTGPGGPAGAAGPAGATGPAGPRGFSAWERIPSGLTLTGRFGGASQAAAPGELAPAIAHLPGRADQVLKKGVNLFFAPSASVTAGSNGPTDAACSGSIANPTAPVGKVCVYVSTQNAHVQFASNDYYFSDSFFTLVLTADAAGTFATPAAWAYTAP